MWATSFPRGPPVARTPWKWSARISAASAREATPVSALGRSSTQGLRAGLLHWTAIRDDEKCRRRAELHDPLLARLLRDLPLGGTADRGPHWVQAGAPIITERAPRGTRAVAGYSPYGGYDLAAPDHSLISTCIRAPCSLNS